MLKGFRDFILRGNVIDLAVAVVVGAAFTNIVNSLVKNLLNPLIAAIVKKPDLSFLKLDLNGSNILYGTFLNDVISFLLIAASVYFFFVLPINRLMAKFFPAKAAPVTTRPCPECLADIPLAAKRCSHCTQPVPVV
ncbi:large conductance mechanosensitive channel protein MscL [Silvibacterium sp.]|uniref:large conductance mechanosensitive channel protein MscL n=1 Tax=Silvibacterium sp. TaxID=1964179 RepID=UPI0039E39A65